MPGHHLKNITFYPFHIVTQTIIYVYYIPHAIVDPDSALYNWRPFHSYEICSHIISIIIIIILNFRSESPNIRKFLYEWEMCMRAWLLATPQLCLFIILFKFYYYHLESMHSLAHMVLYTRIRSRYIFSYIY